jgi:hypothetical protein
MRRQEVAEGVNRGQSSPGSSSMGSHGPQLGQESPRTQLHAQVLFQIWQLASLNRRALTDQNCPHSCIGVLFRQKATYICY